MKLKAMKSFLWRLHHDNRLIEDNAMYASILYELREVDIHASWIQLKTDDNITTKDENEEEWARVQ